MKWIAMYNFDRLTWLLGSRQKRTFLVLLCTSVIAVSPNVLAQTSSDMAGCRECQKQETKKPLAIQKIEDSAVEIYGKQDSCLKTLGPDSVRIYKCMQKFYEHFLDDPVTTKETNQEVKGCADLAPDPKARAAALGMATSLAAQKLYGDANKILEKIKKKLPLSPDEKKILEAIERPYKQEQERQKAQAAISKKAPQIIQSNGAKYDSKTKSWDFSHFDFGKLKKGSNELAALMIEFPDAATTLKKLYIDPPSGSVKAVQLGNMIIIPNFNPGKHTLTPQALTRDRFDQEAKITLKNLDQAAKDYLKSTAQYDTYGNTLDRVWKEVIRSKTPTEPERVMNQAGNGILKAQMDLVFKYGLDQDRVNTIYKQISAVMKEGNKNIDNAIGKIDKLIKADEGGMIASGAILIVGGAAVAAPVLAAAGAIAPETAAAVASVTGTLATSVASGVAVTGAVAVGGSAIKAATKVIGQGGDRFWCRLGSEMLEGGISGQVDSLASAPMTVAVSLVAPFVGPALAALKLFPPSVVNAIAKHGISLAFAGIQAIQTPAAIKHAGELYKQADELDRQGQYEAARTARLQAHQAVVDAAWGPVTTALFMSHPLVEKYRTLKVPEEMGETRLPPSGEARPTNPAETTNAQEEGGSSGVPEKVVALGITGAALEKVNEMKSQSGNGNQSNTNMQTSLKADAVGKHSGRPNENSKSHTLYEQAKTDPALAHQLQAAGSATSQILKLPAIQARHVLKVVEEFTPEELRVFQEEVKKPEWKWCK